MLHKTLHLYISREKQENMCVWVALSAVDEAVTALSDWKGSVWPLSQSWVSLNKYTWRLKHTHRTHQHTHFTLMTPC
jgi:hypothetical protein